MKRFCVIGTIAASLAFASCESTNDNLGVQQDTVSEEVHIQKGMAVEDLVAAIGEPLEVRQTDPVREGFEIWVYEKVYRNTDLKVTGTKETLHIDPITGLEVPIIDAVYGQEYTKIVDVTQFLVTEGRVVSWKVDRSDDRDYH